MKKNNILSLPLWILSGLLIILATGCEKYGADASVKDKLAPEIMGVQPANNMTSIPRDSRIIVRFSEKIDPATVNSQSFFIKKNQVVVNGSIAVSDSVVTFTPSQNLEAGSVYTITITNAVTDFSGNSLPAAYTWSFTTAAAVDNTPPSVLSVLPAANASGVALNYVITINFSELVNPATVSLSSVIVKQGSTALTGSFVVNGNEVKFTPSSSISPLTVYTATVTTGVKDLSGNSVASNYTWSFTTNNGTTAKSFSADVVPVLNLCNTCHTHGWRPSATASTFHANLLNDGYISTTTPTDGKIYKKLSGSHPSGSTISPTQKSTVLTWITEGSKNN